MTVSTDADIDWDKLVESFDNVWARSSLRRKWSKLKSSINDSDSMTHKG
jgi:hypothetical protein